MALNGKQRAALRARAMSEDTIITVGKGGISDNLIKSVEDALNARELVKGRVLENSEYNSREVCDILAEKCGAEQIQVIGTKFVLYRKNPDKAAKSKK